MALQSTSDSDSYPFQVTRSISSSEELAGQQPETGLRVGHERARADEKQQPREVCADAVLLRHRARAAHAEDEVGARAPRAVDESRDVGRIVLAVAVDGHDVVRARAERPGEPFSTSPEAGRERRAFSAVDGELQHEAPARAQVLGRVVDRSVIDCDNGVRERHRPGDDVSASRRGVVAGNRRQRSAGACRVSPAYRIPRLGGGSAGGDGGDGGNGHVHKRRNGVNGEGTETARMAESQTEGATPAECRASGRARAARSAAAWARQDGRREHHPSYGVRVCRPAAPTRCRPAVGTRAPAVRVRPAVFSVSSPFSPFLRL